MCGSVLPASRVTPFVVVRLHVPRMQTSTVRHNKFPSQLEPTTETIRPPHAHTRAKCSAAAWSVPLLQAATRARDKEERTRKAFVGSVCWSSSKQASRAERGEPAATTRVKNYHCL